MSASAPAATVARRRRRVRRVPQPAFTVALLAVASPALAGLPFVTDDPATQEQGHFEIDLEGQYTLNRGGQSGSTPGLEVHYGITDHLEIITIVPMAFEHPTGSASVVGLGDIQFATKWRFLDADNDGWRPAIAFEPTIILPTANANRGLGTGFTQAFLPIWLSKDFGKFTVFGGGGYNINPGRDNRNFWFTGVGVTYTIDPQWTIGAEVFRTTADTTGGTSSVAFNLGVIYNIDDNNHLMMSAGRGITNAAQNNQFSTFIAYQLTF